MPARDERSHRAQGPSAAVTLFLSGDVMTGRGIDQILPHPVDPRLFESYVRSAKTYVELAETVSGPIERPVGFPYIWGDALEELERLQPAARIVNLETAVTTSDDAWSDKPVLYRMHPDNVPCLSAARIDCCVLANNHVLDWGRDGLLETLATLSGVGIRVAGAGRNAVEASAPASIHVEGGNRVLVFGFAHSSSGVPPAWRATAGRSGVGLLPSLSDAGIDTVANAIRAHKRRGDIVVVSLHWGPNWGFDIETAERQFAQQLLDEAGADMVHGHSSHHVKGIEIHRGKLILYGCGDFLNDYEGIGGYERYRGELALMYFPTIDPESGRLLELSMTPTCTRRMRVNRASPEQADWLHSTLNREGRNLGTAAELQSDGALRLRWS